MSTRRIDPTNTVLVHADRRRGMRTQRETDADIRDLERYTDPVDLMRRVTTNPKFKGKLIIQKTSDEALRIKDGTGKTQLLIGMQQGINPFLAMGTDVVDPVTGWMLKLFGLRGDALFNGLVDAANVDIGRWYCGCHHEPGGTVLEVQGMQAWTAGGTIVNDDASDGSWALYTTTAVINNTVGPNGSARFRRDQEYEVLFYRKMGADITSQRNWVALAETDPTNTDTPLQNFIGFRYSTSAGDTEWIAVTGDGAARTSTPTGVAVTANTAYYLRFRVNASQVQLIIGLPNVGAGTQTFTHTTNLPTATLRLSPFDRCRTLVAGARSFRFSHFNALSR